MKNRLGLSGTEAKRIYDKFRNDYDAVVVKGLIKELGVDPVDFEAFIDENSNLENELNANPEHQRLLEDIQIPKFVFTNAGMYDLGSKYFNYN